MYVSDEALRAFRQADTAENTPPVIEAFDSTLSPTSPDDPGCVCYESRNPVSKTSKFFVKVRASGPDGGCFFDPLGGHLEDLSREDKATGKSLYEFGRVSEEAYRLYESFLKTQNPARLRQAETAR
jgi:hypothetical protein